MCDVMLQYSGSVIVMIEVLFGSKAIRFPFYILCSKKLSNGFKEEEIFLMYGVMLHHSGNVKVMIEVLFGN